MILPKEKSKPKTELSEFTIFGYGMPKIGKTTFAAGFPDAVFLGDRSRSQRAVDFQGRPAGLGRFSRSLPRTGRRQAQLPQHHHRHRGQPVAAVCRNHICAKNKIEHEGDLAYGKGYALILNDSPVC
jgi:hypothetical protein